VNGPFFSEPEGLRFRATDERGLAGGAV
jgi:hypothetical protein